MEERGYENTACVVTRQYGGKHLGIARLGQIREVLDQVSQKLTEFSKHSHYFWKELLLAISG